MTSQSKACSYALATALLWSTIATAFKLTLDYLDPWQLVFWSVLTSTLLLGSIVLLQGKGKLLVRQARESFWLYAALGVLNPFLYHIFLFGAYELLPAQQAQALNYSWPVALSLLAVPMLGKKLSRKDILCCLTAYLGVLIISTRGQLQSLDFGSPTGVILALASTLAWAVYWIFNTRLKGDPLVSLLICFLLGMPWIIAATAIASDFHPGSIEGLAGAAYIGVIEMGIAYILWLKALKLAENTAEVSNISYLSPFLSLFFIANILQESIHPTTYIGLVMIVVAVVLQQRKSATVKDRSSDVSGTAVEQG
ncbi:DMT family transporter [Endozoicomonas montiporae]|uniref:Drug/metabolite exporter family protein n=1 Tax=Endozoicomonas montiporae CL-33 TaxID=570277 RepID=A0A142BER5_9GAMM|nr:DMT family transporter [Endozoicomonas montiporae]AMO57241.1 drug/metabolite exporter family protein [Endozoicomonas montiporae CL-33]